MSTKIRSTFSDSSAVLVISPVGNRSDVMTVRVANLNAATAAVITRADFFAAVETECNAIVIDRGATETVRVDRDGNAVSDMSMMEPGHPDPVAHALRMARGYAVLAEHYAAHPPTPPVDEADAQALADLIRQYRYDLPGLLATGRVTVTR